MLDHAVTDGVLVVRLRLATACQEHESAQQRREECPIHQNSLSQMELGFWTCFFDGRATIGRTRNGSSFGCGVIANATL